MSKLPKHVLVIRLSAMGDVAMTVPVLKELASQYPEIKITVLTRSFFSPFFRDIENLNIFEADLKGKHKGLFGLYKLSRELAALRFDAIADLHNVLRSNIIIRLLFGIKRIQIDKGRSAKKELINGNKFHQLKTTHERYADVFRKLGFKIDLSTPKFPARVELKNELNNLIGNETNLVGIAPFAAFKSKAYPLELMEEVIAVLTKTHNVLLFGGGKEEIEKLNQIEGRFDKVINLAGKLTLEQELDVISNLKMMISMDSGNAHLAAMMGIEVITLWGVTHPFAGFYPFNQDPTNALLADRKKFPKIPTSVYGNSFPEGYDNAIATITPEQIIEKALAISSKPVA